MFNWRKIGKESEQLWTVEKSNHWSNRHVWKSTWRWWSNIFCIYCPQLLQKTWAGAPLHSGHMALVPSTSPTRCASTPISWLPTFPSRPQRPVPPTRPPCQGSMRWGQFVVGFCLCVDWGWPVKCGGKCWQVMKKYGVNRWNVLGTVGRFGNSMG